MNGRDEEGERIVSTKRIETEAKSETGTEGHKERERERGKEHDYEI